ncbi:FHA domain-containing protein [Streptomyces sp. NBRC 110611]|nr:FHA domain-containing protein [Streptomyces sp. NBRC 110611]
MVAAALVPDAVPAAEAEDAAPVLVSQPVTTAAEAAASPVPACRSVRRFTGMGPPRCRTHGTGWRGRCFPRRPPARHPPRCPELSDFALAFRAEAVPLLV